MPVLQASCHGICTRNVVPVTKLYQFIFNCLSSIYFREKRFKEEIEQYRQERPKIQQQFSDLKVS